MNEPDWQRIEEVFSNALALPSEERSRYLDEVCGSDARLRAETESLLAAYPKSKDEPFMVRVAPEERQALYAALHATELLGKMLDRFYVESCLGEGGMGFVYKARDTRLGRAVAIKVATREFDSRFEREARAIAALNHPNVCTLHDVGPNYLVMELVEGQTLADRIARGPVPREEALAICAQIADGMEAAHARGIIHRDLKPANVKLSDTGAVKILDFGLAKAAPGHAPLSDDPLASQAGAVMGTAAYMSPEQAAGQPVDQRADIWAFGVILYEMLTGRRAFDGGTTREVLATIQKGGPDLETLPAALRPVIARCLARDPARRWRSIADVRIALELALTGERTNSPTRPAWQVYAVAGLAAILAAGIVWFFVPRPTTRNEGQLVRLNADLGPDAIPADALTAAISPDGSSIVFATRAPDGKHRLSIRRLDQSGSRALEGTEDGFQPFFSPDGKWLGFFAGGQMKKVALEGGPAVTLCEAAAPRGASWGEDGKIVVTVRGRGGMFIVPDGGGAPEPLTKPSGGDLTHRWPQILPGGKAILFTAHTESARYENARVAVLDRASGKIRTLVTGGYFGRFVPSADGHGGRLLYLHQGALMGAAFDAAALELRGAPVPLLDDIASYPDTAAGQFDFSRNGTFVYSSRQAARAWPISLMDESGRVEALAAPPGEYDTPRFSPDGTRLAISANSGNGSDLYVWNLASRTMNRLTSNSGANLNAVWTPDGRHLAFYYPVAGGYAIGWIRSDGGGDIQRLMEGRNLLVPYSFSPDGRRLAFFEQFPGTNTDIFTVSLDLTDPDHPKAGNPLPLLHAPHYEQQPAFSPDGRWLAWVSNETGIYELYVSAFSEGRGLGEPHRVSEGGAAYPNWSKTGRELFYQTPDGRVMKATYQINGNTFESSAPRQWSPVQVFVRGYRDMDLAPDGKHVAFFPRRQDAESVHVTFLMNFAADLARRVPLQK